MKNLDLAQGHLRWKNIERNLGHQFNEMPEWSKHPTFDGYWREKYPGKEVFSNLKIPILTITGLFDDDQWGALYYYDLHRNSIDKSNFNHYLVIGPWDHGGTRRPRRSVGELEFGDKAIVDINKLHLDWFNWVFKKDKRPSFLLQKITYFSVGENQWKGVESWEKLHQKSDIIGLSDSSFWERAKKNRKLVINPHTLSNLESELSENYAFNMAYSSSNWGDRAGTIKLISKPLDKDFIVKGIPTLKLSIVSNVKDFDLEVLLYETTEKGASYFIARDILRARHRFGISKSNLIEIGQKETIEFKKFNVAARKIRKNSRLKIIIGPNSSIHWQRNYNTRAEVFDQIRSESQIAEINLLLDESSLELFLE